MKCPKCGTDTKTIMHFENGINFAFHECPKCHTKTHRKRIHFDEVENENTSNTKRIYFLRQYK